jgi:hypothetical protein
MSYRYKVLKIILTINEEYPSSYSLLFVFLCFESLSANRDFGMENYSLSKVL